MFLLALLLARKHTFYNHLSFPKTLQPSFPFSSLYFPLSCIILKQSVYFFIFYFFNLIKTVICQRVTLLTLVLTTVFLALPAYFCTDISINCIHESPVFELYVAENRISLSSIHYTVHFRSDYVHKRKSFLRQKGFALWKTLFVISLTQLQIP